MKNLANNIINYIKKYKFALIFNLLFTLSIYITRICFYSLSIDTEVLITNPTLQFESWLMLGRYSLVLMKKLFFFIPYNYYLANFSMIILLTFAIFFLYYIIDTYFKVETNNLKIIIFSSLIVSSPILAEQFYFTLQCAEIAICFLILDLALYLVLEGLKKQDISYILISDIFLIFCYGAYPSFIVLMTTLLCFILLLNNTYNKLFKNKIFFSWSFVYLLLAVLCHNVISLSILKIFKLFKEEYIYNYVVWFKRPLATNISNIINSLKTIFQIIHPYYQFGYFILLVIIIKNIINSNNKFKTIFFSFLFFISPFIILFILGQTEPIRARIAIPIVIALGICFLAKKWSKKLIYISLVLIITQSTVTTILFYESHQVYKKDLAFSSKVIKQINNNPNNKKVIFIGHKKPPNRFIKGEAIDSSFYEWDCTSDIGINYRALNLLKYRKYNIQSITLKDYLNAFRLIRKKNSKITTKSMDIYENNKMIVIVLENYLSC